MKSLSRRIIFTVSFLILLACFGWAQQPAETIKSLQEQVKRLEAIDRNPSVPREVRSLNQQFLEARYQQLRTLLRERIATVRKYQSSVASTLTVSENKIVDGMIQELEEDLRQLDTTGKELIAVEPLAESDRLIGPNVAVPIVFTNEAAPARTALVTANSQADCSVKIKAVRLIPRKNIGGPFQVEIELTDTVAKASKPIARQVPGPEKIEFVTESGVKFTENELNYDLPDSGFIKLTPRQGISKTIPPEDKKITVSLQNFKFENGERCNAKKEGQIIGVGERKELLEAARKDLADAVAHAKTSDEKDIFAGFVAAKGDGGSAAGAADISINRKIYGDGVGTQGLFDEASVSLQIKKSSAEKADPRHVNLALTFQKTMLLGSQARAIGKTLANLEAAPSDKLVKLNAQQRQEMQNGFSNFFRGFLIDESLRLEGEAFDFKTVNFVSDTQFQLASISKRLKDTNGFWNLRLFTGPELGRNLSKPEAQTMASGNTMMSDATTMQLAKVNWIQRLKYGGKLALRYLPTDNTGAKWGVELDLGYVNRHLFNDEVATEIMKKEGKDTIKTLMIAKGNKAWRQADLKVFFFSDGKARYGFKLSYNHGQLPPTFTFTKGFQFGFVVESKDDKSNGAAVNANQ